MRIRTSRRLPLLDGGRALGLLLVAFGLANAAGASAQGVTNLNGSGGVRDTQSTTSGGINSVPVTAAGTGGTTNVDTSLGGFGANLRSDDLLRPQQPRGHVRY